MPLQVENWLLRQIYNDADTNLLDLNPEIQRREVWSEKKMMVLIDSVARGIPISAITVYKNEEGPHDVYEVIDGKQRLSTLIKFKNGILTPRKSAIEIAYTDDEDNSEGKELAEKVLDKNWVDIDVGTKIKFQEYKIPVYIITGSRASAVRAFTRMNIDAYPLKPQEIRNAVFKNTAFLNHINELGKKMNDYAESLGWSDPFFVHWGLMNDEKYKRMDDLQFLSELVALALEGPQEARRTIDEIYSKYKDPSPKLSKQLNDNVFRVQKALEAAHKILGDNLKTVQFDRENHLYALIGAFLHDDQGIPSATQLKNVETITDVNSTLSSFIADFQNYQNLLETNPEKINLEEYAKEIIEYQKTFVGGQLNGKKRREARVQVFCSILKDRLSPIDNERPSLLMRRLVWSSKERTCGRCGLLVNDWNDYDCGHIVARSKGGKTNFVNLRVEHVSCNRSAQAN